VRRLAGEIFVLQLSRPHIEWQLQEGYSDIIDLLCIILQPSKYNGHGEVIKKEKEKFQ